MILWEFELGIEESDKIKPEDILDFFEWFKINHNEYKDDNGVYFRPFYNYVVDIDAMCVNCCGRLGEFKDNPRHTYEYLLRYKGAFKSKVQKKIYNLIKMFDDIGWSDEYNAYLEDDVQKVMEAGEDFGGFDIDICINIYNMILNKKNKEKWSLFYDQYLKDIEVNIEYNKEYSFLFYLTKWLEKEYFKGRKVEIKDLRVENDWRDNY